MAGGVEDGANVTIAGILTSVAPRTNKQGAPWAIATLEDLESGIEVLFFPKTWAEVSEKIVRDQIVVVKGRISRRDAICASRSPKEPPHASRIWSQSSSTQPSTAAHSVADRFAIR